jgi:hypothetical protein
MAKSTTTSSSSHTTVSTQPSRCALHIHSPSSSSPAQSPLTHSLTHSHCRICHTRFRSRAATAVPHCEASQPSRRSVRSEPTGSRQRRTHITERRHRDTLALQVDRFGHPVDCRTLCGQPSPRFGCGSESAVGVNPQLWKAARSATSITYSPKQPLIGATLRVTPTARYARYTRYTWCLLPTNPILPTLS